jgi:hypothetical protein
MELIPVVFDVDDDVAVVVSNRPAYARVSLAFLASTGMIGHNVPPLVPHFSSKKPTESAISLHFR